MHAIQMRPEIVIPFLWNDSRLQTVSVLFAYQTKRKMFITSVQIICNHMNHLTMAMKIRARRCAYTFNMNFNINSQFCHFSLWIFFVRISFPHSNFWEWNLEFLIRLGKFLWSESIHFIVAEVNGQLEWMQIDISSFVNTHCKCSTIQFISDSSYVSICCPKWKKKS